MLEWDKDEAEDQIYQRYLESKKQLKIEWNGIKSNKKKCDTFVVNKLLTSYVTLCDSSMNQLQSLCKPMHMGSNFRSLFENFLNLVYLFHRDEIPYNMKIEAFKYCEAKFFLKATDYLYYTKIKFANSSQQINEEAVTPVKKSYFKRIEKERVRRLTYLAEAKGSIVEKEYQKQIKKTDNIYWYTLFSGIGNLKQLSKYLGFSEFYQQFYGILSIEVHGVSLFSEAKLNSNNDFEKIQQIMKSDHIQNFTQLLVESIKTCGGIED